jgi:hypothetical protein
MKVKCFFLCFALWISKMVMIERMKRVRQEVLAIGHALYTSNLYAAAVWWQEQYACPAIDCANKRLVESQYAGY